MTTETETEYATRRDAFNAGVAQDEEQYGFAHPDGSIEFLTRWDSYYTLSTPEGRSDFIKKRIEDLRRMNIPQAEALLPRFVKRTATTTYTAPEFVES
jgi:hypothetical protein